MENVEPHSIKFASENNIIFVPSQYILFAIKIKEFAIQLLKYTDVFENLKNTNDKNILGGFIDNNGNLTNTDGLTSEDFELFKKMFSSSHSLNFGAKSIINGTPGNYRIRSTSDFFGSVILKIINVPDVSSAKLGSLIYSLAKKPELYNYLESRFTPDQNTEQILDDSFGKNVIFYGAPGTGKSHKIETILQNIPDEQKERITFHPEYDYSCFVGGYKPSSEVNEESGKLEITYKFVPQVFTHIYLKAWNNPSKEFFFSNRRDKQRKLCRNIW